MEIINSSGNENLAVVYLAKTSADRYIEFVESLQPPYSREDKWILIISTLYGCPVKCLICDAGMEYYAKVSKEDMFAQIDYPLRKRFPNGEVKIKKFKIQFSRMGDPAFNIDVLNLLEEFDQRYNAPGFLPSISTIAPANTDLFFERLISIKKEKFNDGRFQLQFSVHTTNEDLRDRLIPVRKWNFKRMSEYGEKFFSEGDKKTGLNFAASNEYPIHPEIIKYYFDPLKFIIKITPLNPTYRTKENGLTSLITSNDDKNYFSLIENFRNLGYEVITNIGEAMENQIGSNCGQFIRTHLNKSYRLEDGYSLVEKN